MTLLPRIRFKVADDLERAEAIRLRGEIYERELGYHGTDEFDDRAHQLIALDSNGEICAAIRILGPNHRPFEIERFVRLADIVAVGRTPAQIGGFWIRPTDRRVHSSSFLPLGMLKLAYVFAGKQGITDFLMRTHITQLQRFYERGFFQLVEGLSFDHPDWGRVYVMHLDLLRFQTTHAASADPIARYLLTESAEITIEV